MYASPGTGRWLCYRIAFLEDAARRPGGFFPWGLAIGVLPPPPTTRRGRGLRRHRRRKAGGGHRPGLWSPPQVAAGRGRTSWWWRPTTTWTGSAPAPTPTPSSARILGDRGHLSNEAGAELAWPAVEGARPSLLAHLSPRTNNSPGPRWSRRLSALGGPRRIPGGGPPVGGGALYQLKAGGALRAFRHGRHPCAERHLICVGKLKEKFYQEAAAEYIKRLSAYCRLTLVELPEEKLPQDPSQAQIDAALEGGRGHPGQAAPQHQPGRLCVEGRMRSSEELSAGGDLGAQLGQAPGLSHRRLLRPGGALKAEAWAASVHVPHDLPPTTWPGSCCWSSSTGPSRSRRAPATTNDRGPGQLSKDRPGYWKILCYNHACLWYNVHNSMSQRILLIGGPSPCPILMFIMHG